MEKQTLSSTDAYTHALWLVDNRLLDQHCDNAEAHIALQIRLQALGLPDSQSCRHAVERFLKQQPKLLDVVQCLCDALFEYHQGVPLLNSDLLFHRLARVIDADIIACLGLSDSAGEADDYGWSAIPIRNQDYSNRVLENGSVDTHIHLGGALPPLFYWVTLMSGEIPPNLLIPPSQILGYASVSDWHKAFAQALWLRMKLALELSGDPGCNKPFLSAPLRERLMAFDQEPPKTFAEIRDTVLASTAETRRRNEPDLFVFKDPLCLDTDFSHSHYACGERRLLCELKRLLAQRHDPVEDHTYDLIESHLLDYLRIRNAFHQRLVHDHGSDGLMRFAASFGQRGFYFGQQRKRRRHSARLHKNQRIADCYYHENRRHSDPNGTKRRLLLRNQGRRRKQQRRRLIKLERYRMFTALNEQLVGAFPKAPPTRSHQPTRRIEMRVSIPSGTQSLAIIRAWLEGVRIHLAHDATSVLTDTELISTASVSPSPEQQFGCRHSQVGLLFHLNKRGGSQKCIEQAFDSVRKLGCMLKDYPALRPYIIGLDAAGNERTSPPRVFGQAFRHLHQSQAQQRVLLKDPDIRLGWTYHVGEDVDDLLTGLRHIDETAALLLGKDGGRLGHALALCDDPQRFYLARKNQTEPTLGAHLLDLVWAYGRLSDACKPELISWLKKRIRNLSAPCIGQNGEPHIDRCYHAMNLDCSENVAIISEPALLEKLVECEDEIDELFTKPISLTADQQWIDLVKQLQALLRRRLANRRICIEVNPTSNLIIGGFDDYKTLPYQTLIDDELAVSINTDDPGLFITSLPGEFSAMYNALTDTMSHRAAEQWLVERVGDAERSTFLSAHTPIGSDFPINQDKFNAVFAYHGTLSDE